MCYYIGIEDLVANALIEKISNSDVRFISYQEIESYGAKVVEVLGNKREKAILIFSRESTSMFLRDYSDYFEETDNGHILGIKLKDNVKIEELISEFRGYLPLDVLLAFLDKRSLSAIGV